MKFATIPQAIEEIKKGRMLILLDSKREKEGDFYIPAVKATPKIIATMIKKGGGLVCCAITQNQANKLGLPLMVSSLDNGEKTGVNFTVSVNAKKGITTGISATDRYETIKILTDSKSKHSDLVKPGHVFGLIGKPGGVLERAGHTEAAVDLARLAGLAPSGVLCEILSDSGKVARHDELFRLANSLGIKIILVSGLINYLKKDSLPDLEDGSCVIRNAEALLPTEYGILKIIIYKCLNDNREHAVLILGQLKEPVLTRIHSQCLTGDTFFSLRCDCGDQLKKSMKLIVKNGNGLILYLNQEGRGIGLTNKIKAYKLQDKGYDTIQANEALGFPSDARSYKVAVDILKDLKVSKIDLLTNNPDKKDQLAKYGINVAKRIALEIKPNKLDLEYLKVKKHKMRHDLKLV